MVHKVQIEMPQMTAEDTVELLRQWLRTAEEAVKQQQRMVFVTVRRKAIPCRKFCTLCEHSGISGPIVAAQAGRDQFGDHWKVTALFEARAVVRWCHARIAALMAVHN